MKKISSAALQKQLPAILDEVEPEGILITKDGKAVARLVPVQSRPAQMIGALKGKLQIKGDILSTGLEWNAES